MSTVNIEQATQQALADFFDQVDRTIREHRRFNRWFYIGEDRSIASVYVRCTPRALPTTIAECLGLERAAIVLELANFEVRKEYRRQGVAKAIINGLIDLAITHEMQFEVENVVNRHLASYFSKRVDFVEYMNNDFGCSSYYHKWNV